MNKLIGMSLILLMSGCSWLPTNTEYVKVSYPIMICPAPPEVKKPDLYINKLTQADSKDYGKVAQYYDITLQQLTSYIDQLEMVIDQYNKTSEAYQQMENEVNGITITPEESTEILSEEDSGWF